MLFISNAKPDRLMGFKRSAGLKVPMDYFRDAKINTVDEAAFRRAFLRCPLLGKARKFVSDSEMGFFFKLTTDLQRQRFGIMDVKKSGLLRDIAARNRLLIDTVHRLEEIQNRATRKASAGGSWTKDANRNILAAVKPIAKRFRNLLRLDQFELGGQILMTHADLKHMSYRLICQLELAMKTRLKVPLPERGEYVNAVIASIMFATKWRRFRGVNAADLSSVRGLRHQAHVWYGKDKWDRDVNEIAPKSSKRRFS
jgi:hypothetical protein